MLPIIEVSTKKLYYFRVFEKWWYCFFLFGAWFLPHRCYKVKNLYLKKLTAKEKVKQNMGMLVGILLGPRIFNFISDEVFCVIDKKYMFLYYLSIYVLVVLLTFLVAQCFKLSPNVDREEFVDIRFVSIKRSSIKYSVYSVVLIFFLLAGFSITNISIKGVFMLILGVLFSCLMNFGFGLQKEYISNDGKVYFVGNDEKIDR